MTGGPVRTRCVLISVTVCNGVWEETEREREREREQEKERERAECTLVEELRKKSRGPLGVRYKKKKIYVGGHCRPHPGLRSRPQAEGA